MGKCWLLAPPGSHQPLRMVVPALFYALTSCLVKMTVSLASQRGAMPPRVLVNDGMTWPWRADGGRFLILSWALAKEHAMVPLAVPTQMLGAEVLRWLMGACLVK
jgi:hypothetical protein